jgi:hypothetical protein
VSWFNKPQPEPPRLDWKKSMDEFWEIDDRLGQKIHDTQMRLADEVGRQRGERDDRMVRIEAKLDEVLRLIRTPTPP